MHEGKVVLITGGTSGIGRAAALAFAQVGTRVVISARGQEKGEQTIQAIEAVGGNALFIQGDMARPDEIADLFEQIIDTYGRLDCAFNNAAYPSVFALTADVSNEEFDRVMQVNVKGVWLCMKHEIQQMLKQDPPGGSIVNTASIAGLGGSAQASLYSASKSAVLALTKSAAQEYAEQGIRVNALVPGPFLTPTLENLFEGITEDEGTMVEMVGAQYHGQLPLGRVGRPEEAAAAVLWLCSEAASFVTGHSLIADGGLSAALR